MTNNLGLSAPPMAGQLEPMLTRTKCNRLTTPPTNRESARHGKMQDFYVIGRSTAPSTTRTRPACPQNYTHKEAQRAVVEGQSFTGNFDCCRHYSSYFWAVFVLRSHSSCVCVCPLLLSAGCTERRVHSTFASASCRHCLMLVTSRYLHLFSSPNNSDVSLLGLTEPASTSPSPQTWKHSFVRQYSIL